MNELVDVLTDAKDDLQMTVREVYTLAIGILLFLRYSGLVALRCGQVNGELVSSVCVQLLCSIVIGGTLWWIVGHGISHGEGLLFGTTNYLPSLDINKFDFLWVIEFMIAVTSLDGLQSMLVGRISFVGYGLIITSLLVFSIPLTFHTVWGTSSWLRPDSVNVFYFGLFDPSGATTAFLYSGGSALACSYIIGGRNLESSVLSGISHQRVMEGHNYFSQASGLFFIWMAVFVQVGNGVVQGEIDITNLGKGITFVLVMTSFSTVAAILCSVDINKYYRVSSVINAIIASLNASCSVCHCVAIAWAPLIGLIAAVLYFATRTLIEKLKIDDPFVVIGTQFIPAVWGAIAVALFAEEHYFTTNTRSNGLFYGGTDLLASQILAVIVIPLWGFVSTSSVLLIVKKATRVLTTDDSNDHGGYYCDIDGMFNPHIASEDMIEDFGTHRDLPDDKSAAPCHTAIGDDRTTNASEIDFSVGITKTTDVKVSQRSSQAVRWLIFCVVLSASLGSSLAQSETITLDLSSDTNSTADFSEIFNNLTRQVTETKDSINVVWALLCAIIVFSMQLGFCFLESGGVRSSSVINITFKNIGDCAIGSMCWWITGYGISYGDGGIFFPTSSELFVLSPHPEYEGGKQLAHFFLSFTYMTTAVTIVSGAVAERISLPAYYVFVVGLSSFFYPMVVRSVWSMYGFLSPFSNNMIGSGSLDFAGSIVIHLFGGVFALVAARIMGQRQLPDGVDVFSIRGIELSAGHNKFQTASGTLFLWFAWFAFNAGGVLQISDGGSIVAANAVVTTLLASGSGGIIGLLTSRLFLGYFDVSHVCNSVLVGLVSITAGCAYISPSYAPLVGAVGCFFYMIFRHIRIKLRIDDVIDAGAVHFGGGLWGALSTGLFSDCDRIRLATGVKTYSDCGLFISGEWTLLGVQVTTVVCVAAWSVLCSTILCFGLKYTIGLRVDPLYELNGIDQSEHKAHSYDYIERIQAEREKAVEAQQVAEKVTQAMSQFSLDEAASIMKEARTRHDLELYKYFDTLLSNLRLYKPYLPDTLFRDVTIENNGDCPSTSTMSTESKTCSTAPTSTLGNKLGTGLSKYPRSTLLHARLSDNHEMTSISERVLKYTSIIALFEDSVRESRGCLVRVEGNSLMGVWGISGFVAMSAHVATRVSLSVLSRYKNIIQGTEDKHLGDPLYGLTGCQNCILHTAIVGGCVIAGNIGTTTTRSSIILGSSVNQVTTLSQIGIYIKSKLIIGSHVAQSIVSDYECRPVDVIGGEYFGSRQEVFEIIGKCNQVEDSREWMYEIQHPEVKTSKHEDYYDAFRNMRSGNYSLAISSFSAYLRKNPGDIGTHRLMGIARSLDFDSRYKPVDFGRLVTFPPFELYAGECLPRNIAIDVLVAIIAIVVSASSASNSYSDSDENTTASID